MNEQTDLPIAILGASGYTGLELLRLLAYHPYVRIHTITSEQHRGKSVHHVFPHLRTAHLPPFVSVEDVDWSEIGCVLCALPHATAQQIVLTIPKHIRIVDLSADFRLYDTSIYEQWYGHPHYSPNLQQQAVYGLTEIHRQQIKEARLVANPGCYPTAALLPLIPLVKHGCIDTQDVIIDAKSGVSGAGRTTKPHLQFCEVHSGMSAYSTAGHRHTPEIEQELSRVTSLRVVVSFTPHLIPMNRGELLTIYLRCLGEVTLDHVHHVLMQTYQEEEFVHVLPRRHVPATQHVQGSNDCCIGVCDDRREGCIRIVSTLDNLGKGAAGQAIQNMNVMYGWRENLALHHLPLFP